MMGKYTLFVKLSVVVFLVVLFSGLTGCGHSERDYNTIYLVLDNDPKGLDPALSTDFGTGQICALLFDNLVRFGDDTQLKPGIAKSWSISDDGLQYHFELNQGYNFTNGEEITAEVVKASMERVLNPKTHSLRTWLFTPIKGAQEYMDGQASEVTGIQVDGPYKLTITLEQTYAPFLGFLAMPAAAIVPADVAQQRGSEFGENPVGSGPWILEDWVHDSVVKLRANPNYFYGKPQLERMELKILPETFSVIAEFETGKLDRMDIPESEFKRWTQSEKWQPYIHKVHELNLFYIGLNCSRPPFNNKKVRQAMNYAVDIPTIIKTTLHGAGVRSHGPIPPGLQSYDSTQTPYPYDPEKAKQLLAEAGYPDGFDVELWQAQSSTLNEITESFQAYYSRIGINVKLVRSDFNLFKAAIRQGEPDMYYLNWWADYPDAENFLYPLFYSTQAARRNRYSNPEVDRLIDENQHETDPQKRIQIAREANRMIYEDAPYVFLWHEITYELTQPWVKNYSPAIMFNAQKFTGVRLEKSD